MNTCPSVAIDGPAASGKTTVARAVAARLGSLYLDTGAMYRAVALIALRAGADPRDRSAVLRLLRETPVTVEPDRAAPLGFRILCGGREAGADLFTAGVDAVVSIVAQYPEVRAAMVSTQRAIARRGPVVMAGRDIGTVVLPDAPVKVFLTASIEARIGRRAAELEGAGAPVDRAAVAASLRERDRQDGDRPIAPLVAAPGATILDSSDLTAAEVVERIVGLVRESSAS